MADNDTIQGKSEEDTKGSRLRPGEVQVEQDGKVVGKHVSHQQQGSASAPTPGPSAPTPGGSGLRGRPTRGQKMARNQSNRNRNRSDGRPIFIPPTANHENEEEELDLEAAENNPSDESVANEKTEGDLGEDEQEKLAQIAADQQENKDDGNDDDDGNGESLYRDEGRQKRKGRFFSRKQKMIGGGIASIVITGGIGLSIFTTPVFFINHLREIISSGVSHLQVSHTRKYRRSKLTKISDLFSKDGRRGSAMIVDMEGRGYKFSYDPATKKVVGLTLPDGSRSLRGTAIGEHIDDYMEIRHPLRTSRWKTKRTNALYRRFGVSRRSIVAPSPTADESPDVEVNKRVAKNTLGEPVELQNKPDDIPPDETEAQKNSRLSREGAVKDASSTSGAIKETRDGVLKGDDVDLAAKRAGITAGGDVIEQLAEGAGPAALKTAEDIASGKSIGSKLFDGFKNFFSPTNVLDKVCTIKTRLRMTSVAARNYRALALLKYTSTFIGVADSTRTGKVDPKLMNSVMKRVTSLDRNGNPIGASPGFAYAVKGKFNKGRNDSFKGSFGVDGQLTGTWKGVQDATDSIPGTSKRQCGVISNPFFQIGSGIVITAGKALLCVVSIGAGCAAEEGVEEVVKVSATQAVKAAIENSIRNIFTSATLKSLALSTLVDLSFNGIMVLTQLYIEKSLALPFTTQEQGGELGSILVAGSGVMNKQRSLDAGMVPATTDQYHEAETAYLETKRLATREQSFFTRILDLENPDSAAFKIAASYPMGFGGMMASIRSNIASPVSWLLGGHAVETVLANISGGHAYADDEVSFDEYTLEKGTYKGQSLAVDFAGNAQVILRSDIADIDPDENIANLSASGDIDPTTFAIKSDRFKNHVANCVETIDVISRIEFESDSKTPDKDCMAENPITVRFKAHLAFLDMVDGVDAEFAPEGL